MWNFRRNSPLLLATALRLLSLLCTDRGPAQSGKYLDSVSGEANEPTSQLTAETAVAVKINYLTTKVLSYI
jgi:hypothetical protein